ncbi:hypothetical protein L6R29_11730 [Myxococcota bacterium]|nr:hypothetical protein [Myxococcota bacterium]
MLLVVSVPTQTPLYNTPRTTLTAQDTNTPQIPLPTDYTSAQYHLLRRLALPTTTSLITKRNFFFSLADILCAIHKTPHAPAIFALDLVGVSLLYSQKSNGSHPPKAQGGDHVR